jgi:Flp pilus assembly protein TadG
MRVLGMSIWSRFKRDRRGASAVEFALIAPLMLVFYFGLTELCQAMLASRRVNHVANAVGDLVTQEEELTASQIDDVFAIGPTIMQPFSKSPLKMRTTGVTANSAGVALVDWSRGYGGMAARAKTTAVTLKVPLDPGKSKVYTEVEYAYDSPVAYFIPKAILYKENAEHLPRKSAKVTCTAPCT